jgi:hypothetical protein
VIEARLAADCEPRRYRAYGLTLDSTVPLSELPAAADSSGEADVIIRRGTVERPPARNEDGRGFWINGTEACYAMPGAGIFLVSDGRRILVECDSRTTAEQMRVGILGPALALALHQRGCFVLHASAVEFDGTAVAFLGGHGWGKSTMAGLLAARGHTLITDDVTAIDVRGPDVFPSFPQLKLWPDALEALDTRADGLARVHPDLPKRALPIRTGFAPGPLPLRRLYVLGKGDDTIIEKLGAAEMFEELTRHSYGVRFGREFLASLDPRVQFLRAAQLGRAAPIRCLRRPSTLASDAALPAIIERAISNDLAS